MQLEEQRELSKRLDQIDEVSNKQSYDGEGNPLPSYVSKRLSKKLPDSQMFKSFVSKEDIIELSNDIKKSYPLTLKSALKSKEYILIIIMTCSSIIFPYFLNANWKAYATHNQDGDHKIVNQDWI